MTPYPSAAETATDRVRWATACAKKLIEEEIMTAPLAEAPVTDHAK